MTGSRSLASGMADGERNIALPQLRLHHLHLTDPARVAAITPEPLDSEIVESMLIRGAPGGEGYLCDFATCSAVGCLSVDLDLPSRRLVVTADEGCTEELASIPLLFAKIGHGADRDTGSPIIAIEALFSAGVATWLLVICSGADSSATIGSVLEALGHAGAIRTDFGISFTVDSLPVHSGKDIALYHATQRGFGGIERASEDRDSDFGDASPLNLELKVSVAAKMIRYGVVSGLASSSCQRRADCSKTFQEQMLLPSSLRREVSVLLGAQSHPNILRFRGLFRLGDETGLEPVGIHHKKDYFGDGEVSMRTGDGEAAPEDASPEWCLVTDFHQRGSLSKTACCGSMMERTLKSVATGLLHALEHLHERGIVHRDIKPENILLSAAGTPVLAGFGVSCLKEDHVDMRQYVGTLGYMAPEIDGQHLYNEKVDLYSLGVTLFYVQCGASPPFKRALGSATSSGSNDGAKFASSEQLEACPEIYGVSPPFAQFIRMLLRWDPQQRPSTYKALRHSWFTSQRPRGRGQAVTDEGWPRMTERPSQGPYRNSFNREVDEVLDFNELQFFRNRRSFSERVGFLEQDFELDDRPVGRAAGAQGVGRGPFNAPADLRQRREEQFNLRPLAFQRPALNPRWPQDELQAFIQHELGEGRVAFRNWVQDHERPTFRNLGREGNPVLPRGVRRNGPADVEEWERAAVERFTFRRNEQPQGRAAFEPEEIPERPGYIDQRDRGLGLGAGYFDEIEARPSFERRPADGDGRGPPFEFDVVGRLMAVDRAAAPPQAGVAEAAEMVAAAEVVEEAAAPAVEAAAEAAAEAMAAVAAVASPAAVQDVAAQGPPAEGQARPEPQDRLHHVAPPAPVQALEPVPPPAVALPRLDVWRDPSQRIAWPESGGDADAILGPQQGSGPPAVGAARDRRARGSFAAARAAVSAVFSSAAAVASRGGGGAATSGRVDAAETRGVPAPPTRAAERTAPGAGGIGQDGSPSNVQGSRGGSSSWRPGWLGGTRRQREDIATFRVVPN
mmetsp:Transcript_94294/g.236697  ORF Transcript_94294/g.236697 Transcript_94294/m.236697 type:complete len:1018 (-) Transcript_94294:91-3144(-)